MISKLAIRRWLERPLRAVSEIKGAPEEEVNDWLAELDPAPRFTTPPYKHQKVGFYLANQHPALMVFWGMGLGKTKWAFDVIAYKIEAGQVERALVLVPTTITQQVWLDEAEKHAPHLRIEPLAGADRQAVLMGDAQVVVATYVGWLSMLADKDAPRSGRGRRKWKITDAAKKLMQRFQMVVYDESQSLKNPQSLSFKAARMQSKVCPYRYALTGTPFGRDPLDLWPQFYALDRGESFGETLGLFREACFTAHPGYFGGVKYKLRKDRRHDVRRMIDNRALYYDEKECIDLPEQIFQEIHVAMPGDMEEYYERVLRDFRAARGGDVQLMQNVFINMRQLTSGYVSGRDVDGQRVFSDFADNPKIAAALELVAELPVGKKMVIFNDFIHSGNLIEAALAKALGDDGYASRIYSGTKDKAREMLLFQTDPACRAMILNNQSGALGLNLQVANRVVFFESPVSPIVRQQAEKRCHRTGQLEPVFYYDLVVAGSVDQKILRYVREGKSLFDALVKGKAKL